MGQLHEILGREHCPKWLSFGDDGPQHFPGRFA
jgi:hypothetical protein